MPQEGLSDTEEDAIDGVAIDCSLEKIMKGDYLNRLEKRTKELGLIHEGKILNSNPELFEMADSAFESV